MSLLARSAQLLLQVHPVIQEEKDQEGQLGMLEQLGIMGFLVEWDHQGRQEYEVHQESSECKDLKEILEKF